MNVAGVDVQVNGGRAKVIAMEKSESDR